MGTLATSFNQTDRTSATLSDRTSAGSVTALRSLVIITETGE